MGEGSRAITTTRPWGATCPAIQADIEPLPQPTSSTRASRLIPSNSCIAGASDQVTATLRRAAFSRLPNDDLKRIETSLRSVANRDGVTSERSGDISFPDVNLLAARVFPPQRT